VGGIVGADRYCLDDVLPSSVGTDLYAKLLLYPSPPLFEQVESRNDYDCRLVDEFDRLHSNHRLARSGWEDDHPPPSRLVPGSEGPPLVCPHLHAPALQFGTGGKVLDAVLDRREVALVQELDYLTVVEGGRPEGSDSYVPHRIGDLGLAPHQDAPLVVRQVGRLHVVGFACDSIYLLKRDENLCFVMQKRRWLSSLNKGCVNRVNRDARVWHFRRREGLEKRTV